MTENEFAIDRILRLYQTNDLAYLIEKLKDKKNLAFSYKESEKSLRFLSNNLSNDWLTVYPLGQGTVSIKVGPKKSQGISLFSVVIPLGLALITLSQLEGFHRLVEKLKLESNERLSTILEVMCASRYKIKGYEIELEPSTLEGNYSDFRVKFEDEWIYFECKKEYPQESKYFKKLSHYVSEITQEIIKNVKPKLPSEYRIDMIVFKKARKDTINLVISKLIESLDSMKINCWYEIEGIKFAINSRDTKVTLPSPLFVRQGKMTVGTKPTRLGEENCYFQIMYNPFGTKELQKIRRIIREACTQIPRKSKGVIILETQHPKRMLKVAENKLLAPRYKNVIAILVTGYETWLIPNNRHNDFPMNFVKIAVRSD